MDFIILRTYYFDPCLICTNMHIRAIHRLISTKGTSFGFGCLIIGRSVQETFLKTVIFYKAFAKTLVCEPAFSPKCGLMCKSAITYFSCFV